MGFLKGRKICLILKCFIDTYFHFFFSDLSVIVKVTIAKRSQRKSERKNSLRSSVSNGESPEKILSGRNSPNADNGCEIQLDAVINGLSTPKKGLISRRNGVLSPSAGRSPPAKRSKLDTLGESEKSKEQLAATRAANSSDETCDNSVIYSIKVSVYMGNGRFCFPEGSYNLRLQKLERYIPRLYSSR